MLHLGGKPYVRKKDGKINTYMGVPGEKLKRVRDAGGKIILVNPVTHDVIWHPDFLE